MAQSSALLCMELAFIFIFIPQTRQKQGECNGLAGAGASGHVSSVKRMLLDGRRSERGTESERESEEMEKKRRLETGGLHVTSTAAQSQH